MKTIDRRSFLKRSAGAVVVAAAAPAGVTWLVSGSTSASAVTAASTAPADAMLPFAAHYTTNTTANLTPATNAAVDILSGFARIWQTGSAWNTGTPLQPEVLRANMRHCIRVTARRTAEEAKKAFIYDRQDQSYAMIDGLGPLASVYKAGALAVTSITSAPDGTPATTISDAVPSGAPTGSATGAGSTTSALGKVATLVNTVRGSYSSGNPSKLAYQYPRPWRMTVDSTVADTGAVDAYGFPVYKSEVAVAPQLLLQRSTTPAGDGGFPSGHTNAFWLAGLAYAYAVPERFQEIVTRAFELSDTRILAGMHSPVDVVGGRVLGTALAAAILNDPANAAVKTAARAQALAYFTAQTGTGDLFGYAHSTAKDPYADRAANARAVAPLLTYILPRHGRDTPLEVPEGAEVLLETRLPYLTAAQRRAVLASTALPAGYALIDGPEQWGRLNLFAAADGYGAFDGDVTATLNAADGGFGAADTWRNDIGGRGCLTKAGTGTLTLTGTNRYSGGTSVRGGTLVAGSKRALGRGDITVAGGTLAVEDRLEAGGSYTQTGVLEVSPGREPALAVELTARLGAASVLKVNATRPGTYPVLRARRVRGRFGTVTAPGFKASLSYSANGVSVRLTR